VEEINKIFTTYETLIECINKKIHNTSRKIDGFGETFARSILVSSTKEEDFGEIIIGK
jgi:hypothetical protein